MYSGELKRNCNVSKMMNIIRWNTMTSRTEEWREASLSAMGRVRSAEHRGAVRRYNPTDQCVCCTASSETIITAPAISLPLPSPHRHHGHLQQEHTSTHSNTSKQYKCYTNSIITPNLFYQTLPPRDDIFSRRLTLWPICRITTPDQNYLNHFNQKKLHYY